MVQLNGACIPNAIISSNDNIKHMGSFYVNGEQHDLHGCCRNRMSKGNE